MASTGTASEDADLNRGASDQTLTPTELQDPGKIGEKQEGNQETDASIDKQSLAEHSRVLNSELGVLPADAQGGVPEAKAEMEIEVVGGVTGDNTGMDEQGTGQNPAGGVHFKDAPPSLVGNEAGAADIGAGNDCAAKIETAESSAAGGDTGMGEIGAGRDNQDFKPADESLMGEGFDSAVEAGASVAGGIMDGSSWMETEQQASYSLPEENEDEFSVSDMVWGKVRNHPWWPGQIFDPSESSELASKHKKKEGFLVAYFGDGTFGWCDVSQLKPFRTHFSQMEKQSTSEPFLNAVNCALDEVSRSVELGLICSCVAEEIRAKIKYQKIENAGIREGATTTSSADMSLFEPGRLLEYIGQLALLPLGGWEWLELVIAKAQLASFYRSKGYLDMPAFHEFVGLEENDADFSPKGKPLSPVSGAGTRTRGRGRPPHKRKQIPEGGLHPSRKHKSLAELMSAKKASKSVSGKKGKAADFVSESSVQTRAKRRARLIDIVGAKSSIPEIENDVDASVSSQEIDIDVGDSSPEISYMVGDGVSTVTGQLTGSRPILEFGGESIQNIEIDVDSGRGKAVQVSGSLRTPREIQKRTARMPKEEYSSPDELLSQLCLAARDPMKGYSFISVVVRFFTDFRNSFLPKLSSSGSGKTGRGRPSKKKAGSSESLDLSNMEDSYWTDRIIMASTEEKQSHKGHRRKGESQLEIPKKRGRPASSQKPRPVGINPVVKRELIAEEQESVEDCNDEVESPTTLSLSFGEAKSVPSELDLRKIFRKYGPLKELEVKSSTVIVVFNRRSDAESAFDSATKSSLFGPVPVSYTLRYVPSEPKPTHSASTLGEKDATSVEGNILMPPLQGKEDTGQTKDGSEVPGQVETEEQRQL